MKTKTILVKGTALVLLFASARKMLPCLQGLCYLPIGASAGLPTAAVNSAFAFNLAWLVLDLLSVWGCIAVLRLKPYGRWFLLIPIVAQAAFHLYLAPVAWPIYLRRRAMFDALGHPLWAEAVQMLCSLILVVFMFARPLEQVFHRCAESHRSVTNA